MADVNRTWVLARRPHGTDFTGALELSDGVVPELAEGEVLVRNALLSLDAGTRMWMNPREDSYSPPTPLGSPVIGMVLGTVVAQDRLRNNGLQVLVCEPVPQVVGLVGCAERQLSAARRPGPTTRRRGRETPSRSAPPTGPGRVGGCHSTSNRLDAPHAGVGRSFTCVRDSRSGARNHPYERIHVLPLMILGNAGMLIVRQTLS